MSNVPLFPAPVEGDFRKKLAAPLLGQRLLQLKVRPAGLGVDDRLAMLVHHRLPVPGVARLDVVAVDAGKTQPQPELAGIGFLAVDRTERIIFRHG